MDNNSQHTYEQARTRALLRASRYEERVRHSLTQGSEMQDMFEDYYLPESISIVRELQYFHYYEPLFLDCLNEAYIDAQVHGTLRLDQVLQSVANWDAGLGSPLSAATTLPGTQVPIAAPAYTPALRTNAGFPGHVSAFAPIPSTYLHSTIRGGPLVVRPIPGSLPAAVPQTSILEQPADGAAGRGGTSAVGEVAGLPAASATGRDSAVPRPVNERQPPSQAEGSKKRSKPSQHVDRPIAAPKAAARPPKQQKGKGKGKAKAKPKKSARFVQEEEEEEEVDDEAMALDVQADENEDEDEDEDDAEGDEDEDDEDEDEAPPPKRQKKPAESEPPPDTMLSPRACVTCQRDNELCLLTRLGREHKRSCVRCTRKKIKCDLSRNTILTDAAATAPPSRTQTPAIAQQAEGSSVDGARHALEQGPSRREISTSTSTSPNVTAELTQMREELTALREESSDARQLLSSLATRIRSHETWLSQQDQSQWDEIRALGYDVRQSLQMFTGVLTSQLPELDRLQALQNHALDLANPQPGATSSQVSPIPRPPPFYPRRTLRPMMEPSDSSDRYVASTRASEADDEASRVGDSVGDFIGDAVGEPMDLDGAAVLPQPTEQGIFESGAVLVERSGSIGSMEGNHVAQHRSAPTGRAMHQGHSGIGHSAAHPQRPGSPRATSMAPPRGSLVDGVAEAGVARRPVLPGVLVSEFPRTSAGSAAPALPRVPVSNGTAAAALIAESSSMVLPRTSVSGGTPVTVLPRVPLFNNGSTTTATPTVGRGTSTVLPSVAQGTSTASAPASVSDGVPTLLPRVLVPETPVTMSAPPGVPALELSLLPTTSGAPAHAPVHHAGLSAVLPSPPFPLDGPNSATSPRLPPLASIPSVPGALSPGPVCPPVLTIMVSGIPNAADGAHHPLAASPVVESSVVQPGGSSPLTEETTEDDAMFDVPASSSSYVARHTRNRTRGLTDGKDDKALSKKGK